MKVGCFKKESNFHPCFVKSSCIRGSILYRKKQMHAVMAGDGPEEDGMDVFNIISLLGGLAMFLYGMRLMGDNLKEGSSGTLKKVMGKITDNPIKAFLLGMIVTAIIQSSTATIVITSGLVAAEIITLHQSLGIIIGANVGTTITGQIIRLLDVDAGSASVLKIFQPSTLAPVALIVGMVLIMGFKFSKANSIGNILIGFGILFSGLLNMTAAVSVLSEGGYLDSIFEKMGDHMWMGYLVGAGVAFVLQSSSATIGILQAFALASGIPFKTTYVVLVGVYLGDCVTTAIVCYIGAKTNAKRVGIVNIIYNLAKTILVLGVVSILHAVGLLDGLWDMPMTPGTIANANSVFNLACAVLLLPVVGLFEKLSIQIVKDKDKTISRFDDKIQALNPVFLDTPAIALNSCYDVLLTNLNLAVNSIKKGVRNLWDYNKKEIEEIMRDEDEIDLLTDRVCTYLGQLAATIHEPYQIAILNQYNRLSTEFERLGDHATNLAETSTEIVEQEIVLSEQAIEELKVAVQLMEQILEYTVLAFERRDVKAAKHIEPLESVMDDLVNTLHDNHLKRLREGRCAVASGAAFVEILSNMERISDICSNVGIAVVARVNPDVASLAHNYVTTLHQGKDNQFGSEYEVAHNQYFTILEETEKAFENKEEIEGQLQFTENNTADA